MIEILHRDRYHWFNIYNGFKFEQYTFFDNDSGGVLYIDIDGYVHPTSIQWFIDTEHYFYLVYLYCFWNKAP